MDVSITRCGSAFFAFFLGLGRGRDGRAGGAMVKSGRFSLEIKDMLKRWISADHMA